MEGKTNDFTRCRKSIYKIWFHLWLNFFNVRKLVLEENFLHLTKDLYLKSIASIILNGENTIRVKIEGPGKLNKEEKIYIFLKGRNKIIIWCRIGHYLHRKPSRHISFCQCSVLPITRNTLFFQNIYINFGKYNKYI